MNSIRIVDVARLQARGLRGVVDGLREREHVAKNPERVLWGGTKLSYPDIVGFVGILLLFATGKPQDKRRHAVCIAHHHPERVLEVYLATFNSRGYTAQGTTCFVTQQT